MKNGELISSVLHKIFHTLGRFHEHEREDRDEYIKIIWENVEKGNIQIKHSKLMFKKQAIAVLKYLYIY